MTVTLTRPYQGLGTGAVTQFNATTEAALIAQNLATNGGTVSTGAYSTSEYAGRASIPIGASSVVITHPYVTTGTKINAYVAQAAADATLLRVERCVPSSGSFTIYGTANATAATLVDWVIGPITDTPVL